MESGRFMQIGLYQDDLDKSRKILEKIKPVSVIIMGREFSSLRELEELIKWIKSLYIKEFKIREPLIAVDQEGGNVARVREINYPPGNFALGYRNDEHFSYYSGAITGDELHKLGFHWDLAPVLDVLSNKENASVLERSFGEYVEKVSRNGIAFIRGLQDFGISATAKHFPGNGSVIDDPHEKLPRDRRSMDSVLNTMLPFRQAVDAGVKSIMVSHVSFDAIDPERPASLSVEVYKIVRKDLKFGGLVITDSLDMGAVIRNFSPAEIVKNAFTGADVLECVNPDLADEIHQHLVNVQSDNSSREERVNSLYIQRSAAYAPPPELMKSISFTFPRWVRRLLLDPGREIHIHYTGSTVYMTGIVENVKRRLEELGIKVNEFREDMVGEQIIIIGKNLHLNGKYVYVNKICRNNSCVFIGTGIPYDSEMLESNIGYIASMGEKYENILSSIYAILGWHDPGELKL